MSVKRICTTVVTRKLEEKQEKHFVKSTESLSEIY